MKKKKKKHLPPMVVDLMVVEVLLVVAGIEGSEIYPLTTAAHETGHPRDHIGCEQCGKETKGSVTNVLCYAAAY